MLYKLSFVLAFLAVTSALQSKNCSSPLGIEDGRIVDKQITASSLRKHHDPHLARLNRQTDDMSWCANINDTKPWIKVTLNTTHRISAVAIQGRNGRYSGWYVKKFKVGYVNMKKELRKLKSTFDGPKNKNDISKIYLNTSDIVTNQIMIFPIEHYPENKLVCLRMELYGCKVEDLCKERNLQCDHNCVLENNGTRSRCECRNGYQLNKDKHTCDDINECKGGHSCDLNTTTCHNTIGSYHCICHTGLKKNMYDKSCTDIDECLERNDCQQKCINEYTTYRCGCDDGYKLDEKNKKSCNDINECTERTDSCNRNTTTCSNTRGGYQCLCNKGLEYRDSNQTTCKDVDECSKPYKGYCDHNCHNTYGSYYCSCDNGTYLHSNKQICLDVDECADKSMNDCEQVCDNKYVGYNCKCRNGYSLKQDGKTCEDVNECKYDHKPCSDNCTNTVGSFLCSCKPGLILDSSKRTCIDYDECAYQKDDCDSGTSTCINTYGTFECRCKSGFKKSSGKCVAQSCPPLQPIPNGYLEPADCAKKDAKAFRDVCVYKCMSGYELNSKSINLTSCNADGNWDYHNAGLQPLCERSRCTKVPSKPNMEIVPQSCSQIGGEYNKECHAYCSPGYKLTGPRTIKCLAKGRYDLTFNTTRCVKEIPLVCPKDVQIVLPLGTKDTVLRTEKLSVKIDLNQVASNPAGALNELYRFEARAQSHKITLMKKQSSESCVFHVQVIDKEVPKIIKCPTSNVYITLNQPTDTVTWEEPQFTDNVGIVKRFNNIKNGITRPEQVYYVYYAVRDAAGNEATCRFFVHVKARYCEKQTIPGGTDTNMFWIGAGGNSLRVYVSCVPPKMLSMNITGASIFECDNGIWKNDVVPDCVDSIAKITADCPEGYFTILQQFTNKPHCAKCPKGTMWLAGNCIPCVEGYYQDVTGSKSCKKCPNGMTGVVTRGKSSSVCRAQCAPGTYSPNGLYESNGCDRCPEGSYQNLRGQQSCKVCPNGANSYPGSVSENECRLPARVSRLFPENGSIEVREGDYIVIDCYGTGSPRPYITISNTTVLAPESFRGTVKRSPLNTGNKHISGLRMTITGVTSYDNAMYSCTADNKRGDLGAVDQREMSVKVV